MSRDSQSTRDILATFSNQFWRLISGPLTLLLIPFYLTSVQQGYWYLFGSIAALSTFADLGFGNIILQFSAHEYAYLSFDSNGKLTGDDTYIQKLGSFLRFVVKWLTTICSIVFPIIFVVGIFFFVRDGVLGTYIIPWIIYSIGTLINFFNNSILSFIEGMDQIAKVQKSRLYVAIINTIVLVGCLLLHLNIYALALAMLLSSAYMFITIFHTFGAVIRQIWKSSESYYYPWKKEILPLFKKYIASFVSGYFIFQIYTPLMHYFHGPIYSGKVGISLSVISAIYNFSSIWIYTITPKMNMLVSKREWGTLDKVFNRRLLVGAISYLLIVILVFCFVALFRSWTPVSKVLDRFLPTTALLMLEASYFAQFFINSWALYLRGHKQEPYWVLSILNAVWVSIITIVVAKYLAPEYFFLGLLSSYVWVIPLAYRIYRKLKGEWHKDIPVFSS